MLTAPRAQLIEKIITSEEGVVFKAYFLVYEEEGRMKARLVRAIPISHKQAPVVFALTGEISASPVIEIASETKAEIIISPYYEFLYFVGSKPRAPSLVA